MPLPHHAAARSASVRKGRTGPDRILDAATKCFATSGYHATTTRDIAAVVGLSPAALYAHYTSKEELLYTICLGGYQEMVAQVKLAVSSSTEPARQLWEVFRGFVLTQASEPTRARVVNFEWSALEPVHVRQISRLSHETAAEIRSIVEAGVRAGVFATQDVVLTSLALSSLGTDVCRWFRADGGHTAEAVAHYYANLALRIVGANTGPDDGGRDTTWLADDQASVATLWTGADA